MYTLELWTAGFYLLSFLFYARFVVVNRVLLRRSSIASRVWAWRERERVCVYVCACVCVKEREEKTIGNDRIRDPVTTRGQLIKVNERW